MKPWRVEFRGRFEEQTVRSRVLEGNPLGDPHERPLLVYVPPGYDDDADRRYPSVYVASQASYRSTVVSENVLTLSALGAMAVLASRLVGAIKTLGLGIAAHRGTAARITFCGGTRLG